MSPLVSELTHTNNRFTLIDVACIVHMSETEVNVKAPFIIYLNGTFIYKITNEQKMNIIQKIK